MKKDPLLPLKFAVYGMGVMLLGGFLWLGGKLAMKANELHSSSCNEIVLEIPGGANAVKTTLAGDSWVVQDSSGRFYRFDRCGKLVQQISIGGLPEAEDTAK